MAQQPVTQDLVEAIRGVLLGPDHIPELADAMARRLDEVRRSQRWYAVPLVGSAWLEPVRAYAGGAVRETAGAAATITVHRGADDRAPIIDVVDVPANGAARWSLPEPMDTPYGVYLAVSGSVRGAVWSA